ncbi:MAG: heme exporter protein CcmB [Baekduiaceae bacterium]
MTRIVGVLLRKELLLELRMRESIPAMALFSVTVFVVFHFGLDADQVEGQLAAGVLWVTMLLAALLGINRLFVTDAEQGGFDAFLLAPVDRTALYVAKAIALLVYLLVVQLVAIPAFGFLLLGPGLEQALPGLLLVVVLADIGICVIGTLVAAIAIRTRTRDLIVPLLALPLLIPVVLAASELTAPLLAEGGAQALPGRWLTLVSIYDLLFALIAYAIFDFLLED